MASLRLATTMRRSDATSYEEPRDAISHDWIRLCEREGFSPLLVPCSLQDPIAFLDAYAPDALLLGNGESVGESALLRDQRESRMLEWAVDRGIPVLGVCRGLHLIQVHFGGTLDRNVAGHVACEHELQLFDSLSEGLGKGSAIVNSYHGVGVRKLAAPLVSLAQSSDGLIEALRHETQSIYAMQWHPERSGGDAAINSWFLNTLRGVAARTPSK